MESKLFSLNVDRLEKTWINFLSVNKFKEKKKVLNNFYFFHPAVKTSLKVFCPKFAPVLICGESVEMLTCFKRLTRACIIIWNKYFFLSKWNFDTINVFLIASVLRKEFYFVNELFMEILMNTESFLLTFINLVLFNKNFFF